MSFRYNHLRTIALVAALVFAPFAHGAPDDDARAAYDRGDYDTAYKIWSDMAQQNDGRAQYALGVMHATGNGREKDPAKAFEWFGKAAENGHIKAMYNLGIAYWTGQGTSQDQKEATHWWRMAAERGDVVSQYNLGVAYYNGLGVEQDVVEAARWIRSAAEQNYETAVELLPTLEEKLRATAPAASPTGSTNVAEADSNAGEPSDTESASNAEPAPQPADQAPAEDRVIDADFTAGIVKSDEASVYAVNSNNAPVIDNLSSGTPVKVIESGRGWTKVEAAGGFKLWVFGEYVTGEGENGRISGDGVRARSLPSTSERSLSPGKFKDNDPVTVLKVDGSWKHVQAPPHLHAWVKSSDITVMDKPTESWADRWKRAGGSL